MKWFMRLKKAECVEKILEERECAKRQMAERESLIEQCKSTLKGYHRQKASNVAQHLRAGLLHKSIDFTVADCNTKANLEVLYKELVKEVQLIIDNNDLLRTVLKDEYGIYSARDKEVKTCDMKVVCDSQTCCHDKVKEDKSIKKEITITHEVIKGFELCCSLLGVTTHDDRYSCIELYLRNNYMEGVATYAIGGRKTLSMRNYAIPSTAKLIQDFIFDNIISIGDLVEWLDKNDISIGNPDTDYFAIKLRWSKGESKMKLTIKEIGHDRSDL